MDTEAGRGLGAGGRTRHAAAAGRGIRSPNPQVFALGVKEVWRVKRPLDRVVHTLGWPLPADAFGGSWIYPLGPELVSLGLVVGLDYRQSQLDAHVLLQRLKLHPLVRPLLEGGELLEWGGKAGWLTRYSGGWRHWGWRGGFASWST